MGMAAGLERGRRTLKGGYVWVLESGSLPGLSVGDVVVIDVTEGDYVFTKPGVGHVATVPVATTKEHMNVANGLVDLRNSEAGVSVTVSPTGPGHPQFPPGYPQHPQWRG
jgi:hypothetical protein